MTYKIKAEVLKKALEMALSEFDGEIELKSDYYWWIGGDDLFGLGDAPALTQRGQLTEDYEEVCKDLEDKNCNQHTLGHLSAIIRYLAEQK